MAMKLPAIPVLLSAGILAAVMANAGTGVMIVSGTAMGHACQEAWRTDTSSLCRPSTWLLVLMASSTAGLVGAFGLALQCCQTERASRRRIREADEAVLHAERTRMRFLEIVSHDLRQPLQTIALFSAGLQRRQADPDSASMLDGIRSSVTTMHRMLSGLMDISRLDSQSVAPKRTDVVLADMFRSIVAEFMPLAEASGVAFTVDGGEAMAHTDRVMLECIVRNLISNAIRYTRKGSVTVHCRRTGNQVAIVIEDTGPGIAAPELERIFQEFYRVPTTARGAEGLGLGLAIVRRMVHLLGLSLEVASTLGEGSSFTLLVPAATALRAGGMEAITTIVAPTIVTPPPAAPSAEDDPAALALAGARVLVIDDDEMIRIGLRRELSARGMAVTTVDSADAACALFAATPAPRFDIALVDRDLGADLTGPELLDHLATALGVAIPALVLSGTRDFKVIADLQDGDYPWLSKPLDTTILLGEMGRLARPRESVTLPA